MKYKALNWIRGCLIRIGNPRVKFTLEGSELLLPLVHSLPFLRRTFPKYSSNLVRIAKKVKQKYSGLSFIDIGANVGDTVAILRNEEDFPILCVEGNEEIFAFLKANSSQWKEIYLEKTFVSTVTQDMSYRYISHDGSGHIKDDRESGVQTKVRTLSDILIEYPLFTHAKMVKIDTDGMDCQIIRSELDFFHSIKPILFFEYDPYWQRELRDTEGYKVFQSLRDIGYSNVIFYEESGEYLLSAELENAPLIEDVHNFYSSLGLRQRRYCDICAFHDEDKDIFEQIRADEIVFFSRFV
jgi:FkbM family methyltransferase